MYRTVREDLAVLMRLVDELRAWTESEGGQRFMALADTVPGAIEQVNAATRTVERATAWANSEEGRCFYEAGARAVDAMRSQPRAMRH